MHTKNQRAPPQLQSWHRQQQQRCLHLVVLYPHTHQGRPLPALSWQGGAALAPLKSQKDNKKKGDPAPWYRMKPNQLRVMKERAAHITCTNDFNRPYRCIVLHRGNWTMEEYLHFTETFSPYILMSDPDVVSVGWVEWVSGVSLVALAWLRPRPARAQCI